MPYGGTTPEQDARIERCVSELMAEGHNKVSAIRICKSSVLKRDRKKVSRRPRVKKP